jgi:hypothetical protein
LRQLTLPRQLKNRPQLSSLQQLPLLKGLRITVESTAGGAAAGAAAGAATRIQAMKEEQACVHLLQSVGTLTQLTMLTFSIDAAPARLAFQELSGLPGLQSLSLEYTESREPTGLALLEPVLTQLTALDIRERPCNDSSPAGCFTAAAELQSIGGDAGIWPHLQVVEFTLRSRVPADIAQQMSLQWVALRVLDVSGSSGLFPGIASRLGHADPATLLELRANNCEGLSTECLRVAAPRLENLTRLGVADNGDALHGLAGLRQRLPKLRHSVGQA